ncbi:MAG: hypothetical protein KDA89_10125 [Planctomycetaceae bacterium]|nr:hypothetical protein [Planctomycetaceae bacterium]
MSETFNEFEQQLRELRPVGCDQLLPETMYQAGWDACRRAVNAKSSAGKQTAETSAERRHRLGTFAAGLACGLAVSVSVSLWSLGTNKSETAPRIVQQNAERTLPDDVVVLPEESATESGDTTAHPETSVMPVTAAVDWWPITHWFPPWQLDSLPQQSEPVPVATRPLSVVARRHWSSVVMSTVPKALEEFTPSAGHDQETQTRIPLHAFPAREALLRELL